MRGCGFVLSNLAFRRGVPSAASDAEEEEEAYGSEDGGGGVVVGGGDDDNAHGARRELLVGGGHGDTRVRPASGRATDGIPRQQSMKKTG